MVQYTVISRQGMAGKKWRRAPNYAFTAGAATAPIMVAEAGPACLRMPLAFLRRGDRFVLSALLSLTAGRNLMVAPDGGWLGGYIPASIRVYPFALVPQQGSGNLTLCIDTASGLVSEGGAAGEDFFDPDGKPSAAMKQALDLLGEFERNRVVTDAAVSALADAGVIQPWQPAAGSGRAEQGLEDLYCVDEKRFSALPDDAFLKLRHNAAALTIAYAQMFSMGQVSIFEQFERVQQQLKPVAARLPPTLDGLFGMTSDDTVKFR